ncbi:hypothetical protein [Massilia niabensis]|uniref:Uncharacterized protein n=1 Tax=Massilia niabensis TaxID=544910 RepID=A0ABW0L566_9BURK
MLENAWATPSSFAVVNIVSNYKNVEMSSDTEYECHDGAMMTGVALKGDFVTIKQ